MRKILRRWRHWATRTDAPKFRSTVSSDCLGYARPGGHGEIPLVIGFDFGTSASKIVIQAPYFSSSPPVFIAQRPFQTGTEPRLVVAFATGRRCEWYLFTQRSPRGLCRAAPQDRIDGQHADR